MPNSGECLVEDGTYNIGDKIIIESDNLTNQEYTVSGTITSSLYIYRLRVYRTEGDGKLVNIFLFLRMILRLIIIRKSIFIDKNSIDQTSYLEDYNNDD